MAQPCQDSYSTQFRLFSDMMDYHHEQAKESRWERTEVKKLRVAPLDKTSPLYSDTTAFSPVVTEEAIHDTAENLGLALEYNGLFYPLRSTAYKSLLDRAKIGGSALPKLKKKDLADILNACLGLHNASALLLIRDEKVAAAHSGDERDYSVLEIDRLLESISAKLDERFPGNRFDGGYCDHSIASAAWSLPGQRDDLLGAYQKTLDAQGKGALAAKLMPGVRFSTSDTGVASAKVSALLTGGQYPIHIGSIVAVEHRSQKKIEDFQNSLDMLFAQFGDTIAKLENLASIYLDYPVNAMTNICKKLSLPKKAALEAISMFEASCGVGTVTAHDVFMGLQEIMFLLKIDGTSEAKLLATEELIARALTLNWSHYDTAKAVSY